MRRVMQFIICGGETEGGGTFAQPPEIIIDSIYCPCIFNGYTSRRYRCLRSECLTVQVGAHTKSDDDHLSQMCACVCVW